METVLTTMASAIVFAWAVVCVFHRKVNDGVMGKICLSFIALAAYGAMMGSAIAVPAIIWGFAALQVRQSALKTVWPRIKSHFVPCKTCPKNK